MCSTRNHTETISASDLRAGDVMLDRRNFQVAAIKRVGGKLKLEAERGIAAPIWLDSADRVQVVAS